MVQAAERFESQEVNYLRYALENFQSGEFDTLIVLTDGENGPGWFASSMHPDTAQYIIGRLEIMKQDLVNYVRDHDERGTDIAS